MVIIAMMKLGRISRGIVIVVFKISPLSVSLITETEITLPLYPRVAAFAETKITDTYC